MKSKRTKQTIPAPMAESTPPKEAGTPQPDTPASIVANSVHPSKQEPAGASTTKPTASSTTVKATAHTNAKLETGVAEPTEDDGWVYFTVMASLYSEGFVIELPAKDLTAVFPIRISHVRDVQVYQDNNRQVTMMRPIRIQFRMKKADAANVDETELESVLQLELPRLLLELRDQRGRMVSKLAWMQLQNVKAVPISDMWRSDDPDEEYDQLLSAPCT